MSSEFDQEADELYPVDAYKISLLEKSSLPWFFERRVLSRISEVRTSSDATTVGYVPFNNQSLIENFFLCCGGLTRLPSSVGLWARKAEMALQKAFSTVPLSRNQASYAFSVLRHT